MSNLLNNPADSSTQSGPQPFRWALFGKYLAGFTAVALVLGVIVGVVTGIRPLERRAEGVLASGGATVRFVWPGVAPTARSPKTAEPMTWMPRERQRELLVDAGRRLNQNNRPFDPATLEGLRQWLAASGWFEEPPTVRRESDAGVVIEGVWREPAAVVRHADREYWISWRGKLMPTVYEPGKLPVCAFVSPSSGPPRNASGEIDYDSPWPGEDVPAALELLSLMMKQRWYPQVAGVDLSDHAKLASLTILTRHGTQVVWGGRPSLPRFGDTTTAEKLRSIETLHSDTGRIDAGHPLIYVHGTYLLFDRRQSEQALAARQPTPTDASKKSAKDGRTAQSTRKP